MNNLESTMKNIQMVDLNSQYLNIKSEIDDAIASVISSSHFIKGEVVTDFECNLAKAIGVKHVITVGNGTDALQIALMALDLKPGDEVIVPDFTFIATVEVVALLGLKPVLVDVDYCSMTIDVSKLESAITPRTRAIIPVHLFGQNANMEVIMNIARKYNLFVVEDACQSIATKYFFSNGTVKYSGTIGHLGCTSFFPSKNLGCFGDGGAIFTDDDELACRARIVANHGSLKKYHHIAVGVNSRLDSIQAAVLNVKLKHLQSYISARQGAARYYDAALKNISALLIPNRMSFSEHTFHQYTLRCVGCNRDSLKNALAEKNVPSMVYYPIPIHEQEAYKDLCVNMLPDSSSAVSSLLARQVLSIPMHTELDESQLSYIVNTIVSSIQ